MTNQIQRTVYIDGPSNLDLPNITRISSRHWDAEENGSVDLQLFSERIQKFDKNLDLCCIDWEGYAYNELISGNRDMEKNYVQVLKFIKSELNPKFLGCYLWTPRFYWELFDNEQKLQQKKDIGQNANKLNRVCSAYFPSLYDFYLDKNSKVREREKTYFQENTKFALEVAQDKPVFVYRQHRYHGGTALDSQLISEEECKRTSDWIAEVEVNGRKISGIVWFYVDRQEATKRDNSKFLTENNIKQSDVESYLKDIEQKYSELFLNSLK